MDSLVTLEALFKPKSIAVIGASSAPGKLGHDILANLKNGGFAGPLYPINP
jgi:acetate---CoA ligase (ADP-forming)